MSEKSLSTIADGYFYNLNSLARRIGNDIESTKDAFEGLWNILSVSEKNQAINETIIQPEVTIKYSLSSIDPSSKQLPECYPKLRIQTGLKHIVDETGSTLRWRDEHSGPFSFMTRSQMNLCRLENSENNISKIAYDNHGDSSHYECPMKIKKYHVDDPPSSSNQTTFYQSEGYLDTVLTNFDSTTLNPDSNSDDSTSMISRLMNKTSLLKIKNQDDALETLVPARNRVEALDGANYKNQVKIDVGDTMPKCDEINESANRINLLSSYNSFQSSQAIKEDGIPKTGFEFLDDW